MAMKRSDIIMTIGTVIRRLRQEQGITQEQLAEALGITSRAVSQWECDRTSPDISQLLCRVYIFIRAKRIQRI